MASGPELTRDEISRYARHLILPEVGMEGQRRLKAGRVLVIGAGGLGSPAALYLAAAGVGTLGLVDFDAVDVSNLQRQVLHGTPDVGRSKLASAHDRLSAINPHIQIRLHDGLLTSANALDIVREYDVILDGTDNFQTRYLVNDACVLSGRPLVYGAIFRFEGQVSVFAAPGGPCYRCLYPEPPPPGLVPSCAEAGVFGVLPGLIGTLQATEAIKLVTGIGESLAGRLIIYDALHLHFQELRLAKDPECPVCGEHPSVTALIDYEAFCGVEAKTAEPVAPEAVPEAELDFNVLPAELKARLDRGDLPFLLDVREPFEAAIATLPGSTLIPLGELTRRQNELDPDDEIVAYCHHGLRSANAAAYLRSMGFSKARNLVGGIDAWAAKLDPSMNRY